MISQIDIEKILHLHSKSNQFQFQADCRFVSLATVINELCDIINAITIDVDGTKCIDGSKAPADNSEKANCQENVQKEALTMALETENKDLSDKIGKLETELERTRKALEVALDAINRTKDWYPTAKIMKEALDKITALEQKEVK